MSIQDLEIPWFLAYYWNTIFRVSFSTSKYNKSVNKWDIQLNMRSSWYRLTSSRDMLLSGELVRIWSQMVLNTAHSHMIECRHTGWPTIWYLMNIFPLSFSSIFSVYSLFPMLMAQIPRSKSSNWWTLVRNSHNSCARFLSFMSLPMHGCIISSCSAKMCGPHFSFIVMRNAFLSLSVSGSTSLSSSARHFFSMKKAKSVRIRSSWLVLRSSSSSD